jgi:hypothetical protein
MCRVILSFSICLIALHADEGLWPMDAIPVERIQERYGVVLHRAWIEHVQKSCVRISAGGSGSFVSSRGLILTNHHVGEDAIHALSTEQNDLIQEGFLAKNWEEELPCPNLFVDRLIEIRDVTKMIPLEGSELERQAVLAELTRTVQEETGLQPEVVALYQGAQYHLYLYERFTDIRLVMAPEKGVAFFGGESENFEYPRTDLDCCFFRAYKNGEPIHTDHYLLWNVRGPQGEEPLFMVGHPGKTGRMLTSSHVRFLQEVDLPKVRNWLREQRDTLVAFSAKSAENARIALPDLDSVQNTLHVLESYTKELFEKMIAKKREREKRLDRDSLQKMAEILEAAKNYWAPYRILEARSTSKLLNWARHLVRLSTELTKPNRERLREYCDADLDTLRISLISKEPVHKQLEQLHLKQIFSDLQKELGERHPLIQQLGEIDFDQLLQKTGLDDPIVRKELMEQFEDTDPMIQFAQRIDPYARALRKQKEEGYDTVTKSCYVKLANLSTYPDATFTLRLSYGTMKGYDQLQPMTRLSRLFACAQQHSNQGVYALPRRWLAKESALDLETPMNFVSTHDLIGGNSGSPVVNRKGELVGLIFDGNRYTHSWYFAYDDRQGRAISVHAGAIAYVLQHVYHADALVKELHF